MDLRRHQQGQAQQRGFALMVMLVIMVIGGTVILVRSLNSSMLQFARDEVTANALAQAKDALIGYALTYRDNGHPNEGWGYLPLPDLGSSRNGTDLEGNAAANFSGNSKNLTVIGRLPWRSLGLTPLRDGHGECLWYAVSGSFQNAQKADVLNWDSLGHFDVYTSNGTSSGTIGTTGTSYNQRPVAVIFSASAVLLGENRQASTTDVVGTCGGNYNARNYLDSFNADANLNNIVNYFAGATNSATGYAYNLTASSDGSQLSAAALLAPKNIISGEASVITAGNLAIIVNDRMMAITADEIFRPIVRRSDFSAQISALMNDAIFVAHLKTVAIAGGKGSNQIACTNTVNTANRNFCDNWKEMLLLTELALPSPITIDGVATPACTRVLIFGGQQTAAQIRLTATDKSNPANFLDAPNSIAFAVPTANAVNFTGISTFNANTPNADLLRCIE